MGSKPVRGVLSSGCPALGYGQGESGSEGLKKADLREVTAKDHGPLPTAQGKTFLCSYLTWRGSCGLIQQVFPPEFGPVPDGSRKPKPAGRAPYLPDRFHRILQT